VAKKIQGAVKKSMTHAKRNCQDGKPT